MQLNSAYHKRKKQPFQGIFQQLSWIQIGLVGGLILFEIFNFDTSRFALDSILGKQLFVNIPWSGILAIAFCSIDSLSLVHMFGPEEQIDTKDWLLLLAWLIGAALNASLTWWSVSIIMLANNVGNEVLSKEELIFYAPIIVAALVLVTRIALIGTLVFASSTSSKASVAQLQQRSGPQPDVRGRQKRSQHRPTSRPVRASSAGASFGSPQDSRHSRRGH